MDVDDFLSKTLMDMGLTRYEAMIYYALVKLGEAKAIEVAQASGVPREKTYQILRNLEERNMIKRVDSKPRKWIPLPPTAIFKEVVEQRKKTIAKIEEALKSLQDLYDRGSKKSLRKELNVWEISKPAFEETLYSSLIYSNISVYAIMSPNLLERITLYNMDLIKKLYRKEVTLNIVTKIYDDNLHILAKLSNFANVYINSLTDKLDTSIIIIDGNTGFMVRDNEDYIIQFSDSRIASFFMDMIDTVIRHSRTIEDYLKYWEAVETLEYSDVLTHEKLIKLSEEINQVVLLNILGHRTNQEEVYAEAIIDVINKYIPQYDALSIEAKTQILNLLLKSNPLYKGITLDLDPINTTLIIDISVDNAAGWINRIKEIGRIILPIPYYIALKYELNRLGWKEGQTIWLEYKKTPTQFIDRKKVRIIKKYNLPTKNRIYV